MGQNLFAVRISFFLFFVLSSDLIIAQSPITKIDLWEKGVPGFEKLKNEPEEAKDYWVKHINNPSLTVYLPSKEKANGAAVIICPGGGHSLLVFKAEGSDPAEFLCGLGFTCFVLKYRLAREPNSPYNLMTASQEDAYRAVRLVRTKATQFNIDPQRVGVMGFSAGGEVVSSIAYGSGIEKTNLRDNIDKQIGKPDFQILIYPGPLFLPDSIPHDAPPCFLLAADDDPCCVVTTISLLNKYRASGVPFESHIFRKGGHGFNMGKRSNLISINTWPQLLSNWLTDNNFFKQQDKPAK